MALAVSDAAARDLFVNNRSGDDRFTGRQQATQPDGTGPVRSIEKALRLAQQGDRIQIANTGQPYRESISLMGTRHSGFALQPFVLAGNGAVLDGSQPVPANAWEHFRGAVFRFQPPRVEYQQLFLNHRPATRVAAGGMDVEPPKLNAREWCLHQGYIYFAVEPQKLPSDYPLSFAAKPAGITLVAVQNVAIQDLVVQGFQLDGISALNSARMVRVVRVTSRGNGRSGVTVGGASLVDLDECGVGDNGFAQLLTLPWSETHIRQGELLSNTAPAWVDQGGRVFRDGQEIRGGLDEFRPLPASETPAKKPEKK
jgi:hypothetical protein